MSCLPSLLYLPYPPLFPSVQKKLSWIPKIAARRAYVALKPLETMIAENDADLTQYELKPYPDQRTPVVVPDSLPRIEVTRPFGYSQVCPSRIRQFSESQDS